MTPSLPSLRAPTTERWLLALLCAATLAYWIFQYHPFVFPNNDYYSFERVAQAFAAGELPASSKRGPIFPALIALLAPFMPERHAELHAALVWNQVLSLGVLMALFAVSSRALGRGALLPPLLLAVSPHFHAMALDGLVEPTLGLCVLLAFVAFQRGSPWQYGAAAAAAVTRMDCATLAMALFATNALAGRRPLRHLAYAALAALPLAVWTGLGALQGGAGGNYLELMRGMGFTPAPGFATHYLKEPFYGWFQERFGLAFVLFVLAVPVPLVAGIVDGLRKRRAETAALLGFAILDVAVIVVFGIHKGRYVYPTQWIALLFFTRGALGLARFAGAHAATLPRALRALGAAAAGLAALALAVRSLRFLLAEPHAMPVPLNLAFLAVTFALLAAWLVRVEASAAPARWLRAAGLLALLAPVLIGSIQRKERVLYTAYWANRSAKIAGDWIEANRRPGDRFVTLHTSQIEFASRVPPETLMDFDAFEAETLAELVQEARRRGVTHVVYTWRKPVATASDEHYYESMKTYLAEPFAEGGEVAGFERVATLPLPAELERSPVHIYRLHE